MGHLLLVVCVIFTILETSVVLVVYVLVEFGVCLMDGYIHYTRLSFFI